MILFRMRLLKVAKETTTFQQRTRQKGKGVYMAVGLRHVSDSNCVKSVECLLVVALFFFFRSVNH